MTSAEYKKEKLGKFKKRTADVRRNSLLLFSFTSVVLSILFYLTIENFQKYEDIVMSSLMIFVAFFTLAFFMFIWYKKPSFKEYLLYYIWMGADSLRIFMNEDMPKERLKKSKYFFKQLNNLIDKTVLSIYFEDDIIRNKSVNDINLIVSKYIRPKIMMDITQKDYTKIKKITDNLIAKINDEDFDKLHEFLLPYVKNYYPKKITFEWFKNKFKTSPLLLFSSLILIILFTVCLGTWLIFALGHNWNVVIGVYTLILLVIAAFTLVKTFINASSKN